MGDGTILLNMGLLRRLENESQLAFVLCHEIAHFKLSHLESTLEQNSEKLNDKKWERSVKRSVRRGNYQKALGLLKTVIYDQRKQDRVQEMQADLLGMSYLSRTNYDMNQALSCLELLKSIDNEKYHEATELKTVFHSQRYPFKGRWLEEESTMFGGNHLGSDLEPSFHKDSLLTHPACTERKDTIWQRYRAQLASKEGKTYIQDSAYFHQWVQVADFEIIEGLYQTGNTALALHHCLKLLKLYPDEPYLISMIGFCLIQVHNAMLDHQLQEYVPLPQRHFSPTLKQLCTFIHRLRPKEVAALTYYFLLEKEQECASYPRFQKVLLASQNIYRS